YFFFFQAEDGIRDRNVTGVQTCALPIFLFAVILTFVVYVMGFLFTDSSPIEMIGHWGGGFWDLLEFAMQMTLVVTTGYILADTPIVQKGLTKLSKLANTPSQ